MQSEKSRGNSASGDADSPCSLQENLPSRKPKDFVALAGPFGDHFVLKEISSTEIIFKAETSNSSTDSEDSDMDYLKIEYLQRLAIIREQMTSLDIANSDYYANCFDCPYFPNECTITEIHDDDNSMSNRCPKEPDVDIKDNDKDIRGNDKKEFFEEYFVKQHYNLEDSKTTNLDTTEENTNSIDLMRDDSEKPLAKVKIKRITSLKNDLRTTQKHIIRESAKSLPDLENKSIQSFETELNATEKDTHPNDELIEAPAKQVSVIDTKSILSFENTYHSLSSMELMELNYNPPKKRLCVRESTPRISRLDSDLEISENNSYQLRNEFEDSQEYKISHIFPKVQIECKCGLKPVETRDVSCGQSEYGDLENISQNSANKDHLYVRFFGTMDNSVSSTSYRSDLTETTTTVESPQTKSKKKRLFLRSARNKVEPMDKMTLWEEIRTMEAMKNKKLPKASRSQESFFKKILIRKPKPTQEIDLRAIGSLDIPRKSSSSSRFPSITKITEFCSSIFTKKSATIVEDISEVKKVNKAVQTRRRHKTKHHNKDLVPKVARELIDVRKEQRITLESRTPSYEEHSEYSYQDDDVETYFQQYCIFCFCF